MPAKTACVVGGGPAGIAALKECIIQGFEPTCYELDSEVGGIWHKKDYSQPTNTPAIWESLITNSSKFKTCYSDYPLHPHDTPFLSAEHATSLYIQQAMFKYYKRAVEHYGLGKYINFNTRVIKIRKSKDHTQTGQWEVFTAKRGGDVAGSDLAGPRGDDDNSLSKCHKEVFDFVFVCTGYFNLNDGQIFCTGHLFLIRSSSMAMVHFNCLLSVGQNSTETIYLKAPSYPDIQGLDSFKGTVQHAFSYESAKHYDGKNVLIVGNSLSAADIGSDIANFAHQVYMAVGQGTWIIPRCFANARPIDLVISRSIMYSNSAVVTINNRLIQEAESKIDHLATGIRPARPPLFAPFCLSDDLPVKMLAGKVKVYGRLTRLAGHHAHFLDGNVISGINVIVFCTGYKPDLSFLDMDIIQENGKMELFKMMFPLNQKHNTLALVGQVGGDAPKAIFVEAQARLATLVMAGRHKLPPTASMKKDVEFWNANALARRGGYNSYFVSIVLLMESIAEEIGCYPTFWKVFIRDPRLAFRNYFGPILAAQYRLMGPNSKWDDATNTCYTLYEEGYSSILHMEANELHRMDVWQYYRFHCEIQRLLETVLRKRSLVSCQHYFLSRFEERSLVFYQHITALSHPWTTIDLKTYRMSNIHFLESYDQFELEAIRCWFSFADVLNSIKSSVKLYVHS